MYIYIYILEENQHYQQCFCTENAPRLDSIFICWATLLHSLPGPKGLNPALGILYVYIYIYVHKYNRMKKKNRLRWFADPQRAK